MGANAQVSGAVPENHLGGFYAWTGSDGMFPWSLDVLTGLVATELCFEMMVSLAH